MARTQSSGSGGTTVNNGIPDWIEKPKWFYRRIIIFSTLTLDAAILVAIVIGWLLGKAESNTMQWIAGGVIARSMAVVGSYVFQASWEDINVMKLMSSLSTQGSSAVTSILKGKKGK